jgi:hypothetical protein
MPKPWLCQGLTRDWFRALNEATLNEGDVMNELENVKACIDMLESIGVPAETDALQHLKGYGIYLLLGKLPPYNESFDWVFEAGGDDELDIIAEVGTIVEKMDWKYKDDDEVRDLYEVCLDSIYQFLDEGA